MSDFGYLLLGLIFIGGLAILSFGAKYLVRGSSSLAIRLGVRPMVVGLTVVAFGTSAPELVVSIMAAATDSPEVAIGNVIGSNIANVGLIAGLTAMIMPILSDRSFLRLDMPVLFGSMLLLYVLSIDGSLGRADGAILLAALLGFNVFTYLTAGKRGGHPEDELPEKAALAPAIIFTVLGLLGLTVGARLMVESAVVIAERAGLSKLVIGATIVAVGTSLPELATSLAAVLKRQPDIGLGNIIGSNIFNICSILGFAPLISPLRVDPQILAYQYPIMIGFFVALFLFLLKKANRVGRLEGTALFLAYIAFLAWSFLSGAP